MKGTMSDGSLLSKIDPWGTTAVLVSLAAAGYAGKSSSKNKKEIKNMAGDIAVLSKEISHLSKQNKKLAKAAPDNSDLEKRVSEIEDSIESMKNTIQLLAEKFGIKTTKKKNYRPYKPDLSDSDEIKIPKKVVKPDSEDSSDLSEEMSPKTPKNRKRKESASLSESDEDIKKLKALM